MMLVTYRAPRDDDRFVTTFGYEFIDGQPVEVSTANEMIVEKFKKNIWFEVVADEEPEAKRRGRPPKAVVEAEGGE